MSSTALCFQLCQQTIKNTGSHFYDLKYSYLVLTFWNFLRVGQGNKKWWRLESKIIKKDIPRILSPLWDLKYSMFIWYSTCNAKQWRFITLCYFHTSPRCPVYRNVTTRSKCFSLPNRNAHLCNNSSPPALKTANTFN